jgi:hypothetical protein
MAVGRPEWRARKDYRFPTEPAKSLGSGLHPTGCRQVEVAPRGGDGLLSSGVGCNRMSRDLAELLVAAIERHLGGGGSLETPLPVSPGESSSR